MKARLGFLLLTLGLLVGLFLPGRPAWAQSGNPTALVLTGDGALTPVMADYLERGIRTAELNNDELIVFLLNTPGGDINLLNRMVTAIQGSAVPVVVYVYPQGAMAGSAGTILTLAGQAAAMAPGTAIGAASPVGSQGQDLSTTEATKVKEIMKATVRSLADRRGPAAVNMANQAIDNASAASVQEAKAAGMVDFIATDVPDLLSQLNGFTVYTTQGARLLDTTHINVVDYPTSLFEQILGTLIDPNIVFLLLTLGVNALLIELSSPGGWVAGFIGVVCLALAGYGLDILPVNWFGLVFLLAAFVLFILDIKAPTHGALTAVGIASFIAGSLILFNSPGAPSFQRVSVPLVVGTGLVTAAFFFTIVSLALRAQKAPVRTGQYSLQGQVGITRSALNPRGQVQLGSELWSAELAEGEEAVPMGARVEVIGTEGLKLRVRRAG